jgi:hypothetical protein
MALARLRSQEPLEPMSAAPRRAAPRRGNTSRIRDYCMHYRAGILQSPPIYGLSRTLLKMAIIWNKNTILPTHLHKNGQLFSVSSTTHRKHFKSHIVIESYAVYSSLFLSHLLVELVNEQRAFKIDPTFAHFCHTFVTQTGVPGSACIGPSVGGTGKPVREALQIGHVFVTIGCTSSKICFCSSIASDH